MYQFVPQGSAVLRNRAAWELLSISRSTYYRLIAAGELQAVKLGLRASGVTADSVAAFVERRKVMEG